MRSLKRKRKAKATLDSKTIPYFSGIDKGNRAQAGVGISVHQKYENIIERAEYLNENIIYIILKINSNKLHFINVYAPDMSNDSTKYLTEAEKKNQYQHYLKRGYYR